ncbi:MAG: AbrB/MazE/SpoVT family DNA-binding domain-containing protein, partial [Caldisericia bacterium]|nr:AbrB/MazE/SpoVT family DNA-binding domain-containing protein [Caldisericia bacterium]
MLSKIRKWGNSLALRIPKSVLDSALIEENDSVEFIAGKNMITIKKKNEKYRNLDELFAGYNGNRICEEIDTGSPA